MHFLFELFLQEHCSVWINLLSQHRYGNMGCWIFKRWVHKVKVILARLRELTPGLLLTGKFKDVWRKLLDMSWKFIWLYLKSQIEFWNLKTESKSEKVLENLPISYVEWCHVHVFKFIMWYGLMHIHSNTPRGPCLKETFRQNKKN